MSCPRAKSVQPGSETPAKAPAPTPLSSGASGLSGGAIAGIVVGTVLGLALIAGAAFWFWRRNKKSKKAKMDGDTPPAYPADAKEQPPTTAGAVEAPPDTVIREAPNDNEVRPELEAGGAKQEKFAELPTTTTPMQEKTQPAELLAEVPGSERSGR